VLARASLNPPRNGEGDREAVEGPVEAGSPRSTASLARPGPSVSPAGCHLPVPGRIFTVKAYS
jgi:hypothetical protein